MRLSVGSFFSLSCKLSYMKTLTIGTMVRAEGIKLPMEVIDRLMQEWTKVSVRMLKLTEY